MTTGSVPSSQSIQFKSRRSALEALYELWEYRDLLRNLVVRDLKVRYKNSVLGILWSLLNPLFMMIVFTVVFTVFWPNDQIEHFAAFMLVGLLPWNLFQAAMMAGTQSIVGNSTLIKKVYFPREVLPISAVLSNTVNFLVALIVLFPVIWLSGIPLTQYALWLPLILGIQLCFMTGLVLMLCTLNVFYRDTGMILEVALLAGFFLTPIFYPMGFIPNAKTVLGVTLPVHRLVRWLNPMASIIDSYRTVLYGNVVDGVYYAPSAPALDFMLRTVVTALLVLWIGWTVFHRYSGRFGEEV